MSYASSPPSSSDPLSWIRGEVGRFRALGPALLEQARLAKLAQGDAQRAGAVPLADKLRVISSDASSRYNSWNTTRNLLDSVNAGLVSTGLPGLGAVPLLIVAGVSLIVLAATMYALYQHYDDNQQRLELARAQLEQLKAGQLTGSEYAEATGNVPGAGTSSSGGVAGAIAGVATPILLLAAGVYFLPRILDSVGRRR